MGNPNDNSELFEIFQNQVDLEEEQEQGKQKANESDEEDQPEEETENAETDEKTDETDQLDQQPSTSDPEPEKDNRPSTSPDRSPSGATQDSTSQTPQPQSPPPPEQPKTPSSTVAADDESNPDTETGSYIKELEEEKELEGKIILSRGTSVFLLILAFCFMIGSYLIGMQFGANQIDVANSTSADTDKNRVVVPGASSNKNSSSSSESDGTKNSKGTGPLDNTQKNKKIAQNTSYYTFALISYSANEPEVEKMINNHIRTLKTEAGLNQVGFLRAEYSWNNEHWIVLGEFKDRESAKNIKQKVRARLDRTQHADDYNADIVKLSSTQKQNIQFPN